MGFKQMIKKASSRTQFFSSKWSRSRRALRSPPASGTACTPKPAGRWKRGGPSNTRDQLVGVIFTNGRIRLTEIVVDVAIRPCEPDMDLFLWRLIDRLRLQKVEDFR